MAGFSEKTLDFLMENTLADSREWFAEHRAEYKKHVAEPLAGLVRALEPHVLAIDGEIITRAVSVISRINRDTRFSKDKSLYRDHMWLVFARDKRDPGCPALWFEIGQSGWSAGVGLYTASPAYMSAWRQLILSGSPVFWEAKRACEGQSDFTLGGDRYKKPRCPGADPELTDWLELKNVFFIHEESGYDIPFSEELPDTLGALYAQLAPCYRLLLAVWELSGGASETKEAH